MKVRKTAFVWSLKTAWKLSKKVFIIIFSISTILAILPSCVLLVYQDVINTLTFSLSTNDGISSSLVIQICCLGAMLALMALSNRFNDELVSVLMYDSYYLGLQELLINRAKSVNIEELMDKNARDEYISIALNDSSLTTFMSSIFCIWQKVVSISLLLVITLRYSVIVFLCVLLYIGMALITNAKFIKKTQRNDRYIRSARTRANYFETLCRKPSAAKELRLYCASDTIIKQWEDAYQPVKQYDKKRQFYIYTQSLFTGLIFYIFLLSIIVLTLLTGTRKELNTAIVLMLVTLCLNLQDAVSGIIRLFLQICDALFYLNKQKKLFSEDIGDKTECLTKLKINQSMPIFKADMLSYKYPDGTIGLDKVSFEIKENEKVALIGLNGSGKTTLVKLLLGIFSSFSGELFFKGINYADLPNGFIFDNVAAYFQDCVLLHKSLRDNVAYGNIALLGNDAEIQAALEKGGGAKLLEKLPNKLNTTIGKKVKKDGVELSGGEKQRIGVSRIHISQRPVFIMDEPASALDPISEIEQFERIFKHLSDKTAILISHRVGIARMADRIIVMDSGQVVENGTHSELIQKKGVYYHLYKTQEHLYT